MGLNNNYSILQETLCIYCQRQFVNPQNLQRHVLKRHPDTYAANAIQEESHALEH